MIGFAAETGSLMENATAKRARKGCDWIVANDVSPESGIMGGEENAVHLITAEGDRALAASAQDGGGGPPGPAHRGDAAVTVAIAVRRLPHGEGLPLPSYATAGAAGMDLVAAVDAPVTIAPRSRALIPTGLAVALPPGYELQIRPRSGLALRHGIVLPNSPGTIDEDYRGEIQVILLNAGEAPFVVERGTRIAQAVLAPVTRARWQEVASLDDTARAQGGFGSTGI